MKTKTDNISKEYLNIKKQKFIKEARVTEEEFKLFEGMLSQKNG